MKHEMSSRTRSIRGTRSVHAHKTSIEDRCTKRVAWDECLQEDLLNSQLSTQKRANQHIFDPLNSDGSDDHRDMMTAVPFNLRTLLDDA